MTRRSDSVTSESSAATKKPKEILSDDERKLRKREKARLRKQKERKQGALKILGPEASEKPKKFDPGHAQSVWNTRNEFEPEEKSEKTETRQVFLSKKTDADVWIVHVRAKGEKPQSRKYLDRKIALNDFLDLSAGITPSDDWRTIDSYAQRASAFLLKAEMGEVVTDLTNDRLGFVFCAVYLRERGFEGLAGSKELSPRTWKRKFAAQRRVYNVLGNVKLPESLPEFRGLYRQWCEKLVLQTEAIAGFLDQESYLKEAVEIIELYADAFPGLVGCKGIRDQIVEDILDKHVKTSKTGRLRRTNSYRYIPIVELTHILQTTIKFQHQFNSLILELSTGLRVEDLERVVEDPDIYLLDGTHFNYRSIGIDDSDKWLVGKTGRYVDPLKLVNPSLSLVSRIILKNNLPIGWIPNNPFDTNRRKASGDPFLTKYPERCIRATCATLLSYCELIGTVEDGRATRDTAAQRLGHVDTRTVVRTYAPHLPTNPDPFDYFEVDKIVINGEWITQGSTLYDTYLLMMFMQWYQARMSKKEYSALINMIVEESNAFRRVTKGKAKSRTFLVKN